MEWTPEAIDRIEQLFRDRFEQFVRSGLPLNKSDSVWLDFCDKYEVVQMSEENLKDCFNFGPEHHRLGDVICIENPEADIDFRHLFVPKKFAENCLILGFVPS